MKKIKSKILIIISIIIFIYLIIPVNAPFKNYSYSKFVLDCNGEILRVFTNKDQQWCIEPDASLKIPSKLKAAVLNYEDKYFYYHPGFNPISLIRAFYLNSKFHSIKSGGSTITMQLARISKPNNRTYLNKIIEIFKANKYEIKYTKNQILEMYLNHAPYGGNIIGYQTASLKYFKKKPENLTWSEAATLAILPNSPGLIHPGKNQDLLIAKRNRLLKYLYKLEIFDKETLKLSIAEPAPVKVHKFPATAPHFTEQVISNCTENNVYTTIEKNIQKRMEQIAKKHDDFHSSLGIKNLSILVLETKTRKIRAYIGSQDYWDLQDNGQVDGIKAPRSTGSIIKPFLYAASIDEGLIVPKSKIQDVPTYFGAFSPLNADYKFNGLVTAEEALIRSLNVPAVRLLNIYGYAQFQFLLEECGMSTLFRNPDDYGLTLIIGGAETNLWDLGILYSGLGNYGKFQGLKYLKEDDSLYEKSLISPGASYLTLNILKNLKRPGSEFFWNKFSNQWPLAWKTGTSFGQRDAWAAGVNPEWTIIVWVGNFTGETNKSIRGAERAGPILFEVFNSLEKSDSLVWFEPPLNEMISIKICSETGYAAGADCLNCCEELYPKNAEKLKVCPFHKKYFLSKDENSQVCSLCWEEDNVTEKSMLVYPPSVIQYLRERGNEINNLPPHNPNCPSVKAENPVSIEYPGNNTKIFVPRDIGGKFEKVRFRVAHRNKNATIYWYLNDQYMGSSIKKHVKFVDLKNGKNILEVVDESGNKSSVTFDVYKNES